MPRYLASQVHEIYVEAPNASVAREIAERALAGKLIPGSLRGSVGVVSTSISPVKVEKAE